MVIRLCRRRPGRRRGLGYVVRRYLAKGQLAGAEREAEKMLRDARREADTIVKEARLEAKEEVHRVRTEVDAEVRERREELGKAEQRVTQREELLEARAVGARPSRPVAPRPRGATRRSWRTSSQAPHGEPMASSSASPA